ncbi:transcriptional regulator LysR [Acidisphaera rubrifaciens HS-AP3]|uniref:Transcriptional regulator LysR n=2 Tax=Acidisphaera TaxID=50714 RepID=A0A0D6P3H8_9PROT|nr:transcriptional regulator LysR [Acidisphaera rubrifaciens HS-AP3]
MELSDLDLGLLLALDALLQDTNVTRAAARLGISQSALSGRLGRLRELFGDPLFVPASGGRGVVATPLADALAQLRRLIEPTHGFDPARSRRTFVIAVYENPATVFAPALVAHLAAAAPGARIAFVAPGADTAERLERGGVDLLLGADRGREGLICRKLLDSDYATAQRRGHPRGTGPLDLDAFCALDHVLISADGGGFAGVVDDALASLGRSRRVVVSTQSYALAPLIVAGSDCIGTMPRRVLQRFAAGLDLFAPPLALPSARLYAFWHPRSHADPGHAWLRERLYEAAEAAP